MDGFTVACVVLAVVWISCSAYMAFMFFKIFRSK